MKETLRILLLAAVTIIPDNAIAETQDIVLLIDNSGSMIKNDPQSLTKQAVAQFVQNAERGTRIALLTFDEKVKVLNSLTPINDESRFDLLANLEYINFKGLRTDSGKGLRKAIAQLNDNSSSENNKTIVFLTDGIVDTGQAVADAKATAMIRQELTHNAIKNRIHIHTIAFTDKADKVLLEEIARKTGGSYSNPRTAEELTPTFAKIKMAAAMSGVNAQAVSTKELLPNSAKEPASLPNSVATEPTQSMARLEPASPTLPPASVNGDKNDKSALSPDSAQYLDDELKMAIAEVARESHDSTAKDRASRWLTALLTGAALFAIAISGMTVYYLRRLITGSADGLPKSKKTGDELPPAPRTIAYLYLNKDAQRVCWPLMNGVYDLTGKTTLIGRAPGEGGLTINDTKVSRQHAVIEFKNYSYWLIDQSSGNGTFVNGEELTEPYRLNHGDHISFFDINCQFLMPGRDNMMTTEVIRTRPPKNADETTPFEDIAVAKIKAGA